MLWNTSCKGTRWFSINTLAYHCFEIWFYFKLNGRCLHIIFNLVSWGTRVAYIETLCININGDRLTTLGRKEIGEMLDY